MRTMMVYVLGPLIVVLMGGGTQNEPVPADLARYIARAKTVGMSENGETALRTVASLILGEDIVKFEKDVSTGLYSTRFISKECSLGKSGAIKAKALEAEVGLLKALADKDKSGFLSTSEAERFQELVEFGYQVAGIFSNEGGDINRTASAFRMDPNSLRSMIGQYRTLFEEAGRHGVKGLPSPPL